jgi:predicted ribosome quality control (RQC) complex YloA/Tae2 family protein
MRNLTNGIDKLNRKAENDKARIDARRIRQIGKLMMSYQDEIDKLKRMILRMDIQMSVAKLDPCAAAAFESAVSERDYRREQAAKRAEKKRAAQKAAQKAAAEARRAEAKAAAETKRDETADEINHFIRLLRG